jgi:hypothetical protein
MSNEDYWKEPAEEMEFENEEEKEKWIRDHDGPAPGFENIDEDEDD